MVNSIFEKFGLLFFVEGIWGNGTRKSVTGIGWIVMEAVEVWSGGKRENLRG